MDADKKKGNQLAVKNTRRKPKNSMEREIGPNKKCGRGSGITHMGTKDSKSRLRSEISETICGAHPTFGAATRSVRGTGKSEAPHTSHPPLRAERGAEIHHP